MKLSIIIPVYNEVDTVLTVIGNVESVKLQRNVKKEILIIDDGSTDGTKDKLHSLKSHPDIQIFDQESNQGKTSAVKIGLLHATGDVIIIQDADLEYSPDHYPLLLEPILDNQASIVYGSRFMGSIKNMTWVNRLANRISNLTINSLFKANMSDFHTCLKMFKKEALKDIQITTNRFSFDTELTAKFLNKGYTIHEVPITYKARKRNEGKKITWSTALESYFFLVKYGLSQRN